MDCYARVSCCLLTLKNRPDPKPASPALSLPALFAFLEASSVAKAFNSPASPFIALDDVSRREAVLRPSRNADILTAAIHSNAEGQL
jgi:hypothetical protein